MTIWPTCDERMSEQLPHVHGSTTHRCTKTRAHLGSHKCGLCGARWDDERTFDARTVLTPLLNRGECIHCGEPIWLTDRPMEPGWYHEAPGWVGYRCLGRQTLATPKPLDDPALIVTALIESGVDPAAIAEAAGLVRIECGSCMFEAAAVTDTRGAYFPLGTPTGSGIEEPGPL